MTKWLVVFVLGCASAKTPVVEPAALVSPAPIPAGPVAIQPSMRFAPVNMPSDLAMLKTPVASSSVNVDGTTYPLSYTVLRRTGDEGFGQLYDKNMKPIKEDGMCNEQDFSSILTIEGQAFLLSHFECTPGSIALSKLTQTPEGVLSIVETTPIDFSSVGGTWNPCAGQVTPWNTHLASEEYEADARAEPTEDQYWRHRSWNGMKRFQDAPLDPYQWGWTPEVRVVDAAGTVEVRKHLAPGRASHEIAYVLPDQHTVYLSDDGSSAVGWYMFVADEPGDLSAGHLYAARFTARSEGVLDIGWVPLGHATDAVLRPILDSKLVFTDLFEAAEPNGEICPDGFRFVRHSHGEECLKLAAPSSKVADPAMAASRFEKRRYAAYMGASIELAKGEGVTYDPNRGRVYLAVSRIVKTMTDDKGDLRLPENRCGVVYGGPTAKGVVDTEGNPIPSEHVMTGMEPDVAGIPTDGGMCDFEGISNPDNIAFLPDYDQLVVAEDTGNHANAILWAYNRDGVGTKVMVAPPFGEFTGIHWIPNVGGFGYLTVTVQHPWSEGADKLPVGITEDDTRTFTGVLGPFPTLR